MPILPTTDLTNFIVGDNTGATHNGSPVGDLIIAAGGDDTVSGQAAGDVIYGNKGSDTLNGNQGPDVFVWTNGDGTDTVNGNQGIDTQVVEGSPTAGEDFELRADGGGAVFERSSQVAFQINLQSVEELHLQSLGGNDDLLVRNLQGSGVNEVWFRGGDGSDSLRVQGSTAILAEGENGADDLRGGSGDDQLHGGAGNDQLRGIGGDDWLEGGNGGDTLSGGSGRDVLAGGNGNDQMNGGPGGDLFLIRQAEGNDFIQNFAQGSDVIVLQNLTTGGAPLNSFAQLGAALTEQNGDTVIDLSGFNTNNTPASVTVDNVTGLTATDFLFL